jgi:uncharacterized membrane protein (UPF0136 family)
MGIVLIVYGAIAIAAAPVVFRIAEERTLSNTGIIGAVFGLVLAISGIAVLLGSNAAGYVGVGANALLMTIFAMRYNKTGKMMPAGMMLSLSVVVAAFQYTALF